jgi:hypothetical protein
VSPFLTVPFGSLIVVLIVWEVFEDLFQPSGTGALSSWIGRRLFRLLRRWPRRLPLAGPLTVVVVIGTWVALLTVGFALIYAAGFPQDFRTSMGVVPDGRAPVTSMLYFSLATLVTLSFDDLVPDATPLRFVSDVEALIGFGLLTASVSSIVLLYPALSRLRSLARRVSHICAAEQRTGVPLGGSGSDRILAHLASDVASARISLVHFPVLFYFATNDPEGAIAHWTRDLARFARDAREASEPAVRLAAAVLDEALTDLADLLRRRFLDVPAEDRDAVFDAFARAHGARIDRS